jgi:hypothetical protein
MSIQAIHRESFTAIVNALAGASTDTSVVVPIATASIPINASGRVALVRVVMVAIFSDGHSSYSNVRYLIDGSGPTRSDSSNEGGQSTNATDDAYAHIESFNGSNDAVVTIHNDGSGNRTCDCYLEIETVYVKT